MNLLAHNPPRQPGPIGKAKTAPYPKTLQSPRLMWQRRKLLRLRAALSERIRQLAEEAREDTPGYSFHMADAASDSFDRDLTLGLASFEQEELYETDAALKRIEDGTYGLCELTGRPIPWKRLQAIPWTRFSIEAEAGFEGDSRPHIGALGTVRSVDEGSSETSLDEPSVLKNEDLLSKRCRKAPKRMALRTGARLIV